MPAVVKTLPSQLIVGPTSFTVSDNRSVKMVVQCTCVFGIFVTVNTCMKSCNACCTSLYAAQLEVS
jgi:hypothetical protein